MTSLRTRIGLAAAVLFGIAGLLASEEAVPSKEAIDALVKDLGADKADVRDRATKELEKIGEPAVPALREAARSDDPEVSWRARTVLDHIEGAKPGGKTEPRGPGGRDEGSRLHSFNFRFSPGAAGSSVIITQDGSGRVSLKVTEEENGRAVTQSYEAESAEAFKQKYPEVAKKYGIGEAGRAPRIMRDFVPRPRLFEKWGLDEEFFDKDWPNGLGRDMDEMQERIRKQMDEVFRRHGMEPWGWRSPRRPGGPGADAEPPARNREEAEGRAGAPAPANPGAARDPEDRPSTPATLGVRVAEIEPALRAQLKLGEQEGVLVEAVEPGGRAAKGGIQAYDVIVSVGGARVKGVWELRRVLRETAGTAKDGFLEVEIIRGGAKQALKVKMAD